MISGVGKRGRPSKHRAFDDLFASCPKVMKRPKYCQRIGVRRGAKGDTVWIKVQLPKGGVWKGQKYPPGQAAEIKLGWKSSISWDQAIDQRDDLQGRADRGESLEEIPVSTFQASANDWLGRKQGNVQDYGT